MTTGCVPSTTPSATPPTGCVVNASLFAAPTVITTLLDAPVGGETRARRDERVRACRRRARDLTAGEGRTPATAATVIEVQASDAGAPDPSRSRPSPLDGVPT